MMNIKVIIYLCCAISLFACEPQRDYDNLYWGMSQENVEIEMHKTGYDPVSRGRFGLAYEIPINEHMMTFQFEFSRDNELREILIYPDLPHRLTEEKCDTLLPVLKGCIEKRFGAPIENYDPSVEQKKRTGDKSKWYVYEKGRTKAWLRHLDYGRNRFLFDVMIGEKKYIDEAMVRLLGGDFRQKYYKIQ